MWANYGGNHAGVCLKLNGHKLAQKLKEIDGKGGCKTNHDPVSYDDKKAMRQGTLDYSDIEDLGIREGMRRFCYNNCDKIFLVKSTHWKSENEYRWLIHKPDTKNLPVFISIEGILDGVLAGLDFPKAYKPLLGDLCKNLHISAGEMKWHNGLLYQDYGSIYAP